MTKTTAIAYSAAYANYAAARTAYHAAIEVINDVTRAAAASRQRLQDAAAALDAADQAVKPMTVTYEWDCETVADGDSADFADGDIVEHAHDSSFRDVHAWADQYPCEPGRRYELVLVRDDDEGRSWAYVTEGTLPARFTDANGADAAKVPQRFHREVAANFTSTPHRS